MSKVYNASLDENYGQPAEMAVVNYLKAQEGWWTVIHHPYGEKDVDIQVITSTAWFIDVERRRNWESGEVFPFPTIRIPARKEKMIRERVPFIYFSVRSDLKRAALVEGKTILEYLPVPRENVMTSNNDLFFEIPRPKIYDYRNL